jgi:hypothetical protein
MTYVGLGVSRITETSPLGAMLGMTNLMPWALALGTALCIAGCATPYTEHGIGLTGGVEAQMITDTARISARGNAYTSGSFAAATADG